MSDYDNLVGNLSTVIKLIIITVFPSVTTYVQSDLLYTTIVFIVCLCIGIIDAKFPNTFKIFDNHINPDASHDESTLE